MRLSGFSLLEQMRITESDLESRKALLGLTADDLGLLEASRAALAGHLDEVVEQFYRHQARFPEIDALIGDADTLRRLRLAQRRYIEDLFVGHVGLDYVNDRLRIGLVHKRIGVDPKLYLSAVHELRRLLTGAVDIAIPEPAARRAVTAALDKLMFFDIALVFETYIQSMLTALESERKKAEHYAETLEEKVNLHTGELRTDPLTGLTTRRHLDETFQHAMRAAQRRQEPLCVAFIDVDDFKAINDQCGHARGDEVLRTIGHTLREVLRSDDFSFRYGGDEFCVILTNCDEKQAHGQFFERLRARLAEVLPAVHLSVGIAQAGPEHYTRPQDLLAEADSRMYALKQARKAAAAALTKLGESKAG